MSDRRGLQFFGPDTARDAHDTPMMRPPVLDQTAREALPEFRAAGGSTVTLLHGDPESPDDGGMSLVSVRIRESEAGWERIIAGVRSNRDRWAGRQAANG